MAKATLPTNYKDDIMASSMKGLRRYRQIQNDDGTVSFEDVTDYEQVGSNFGAAQMNQTNTAVNNSADKSKIIDRLTDVAANTQAGMMAGALAVRELNNKSKATRIADFSANSNFKVNHTSIFYCPASNMVMFCINGDFQNGARQLGTIGEKYRPDFEVQLQSSLNQYGAIINTEGQVILNQNSVPTGTVLVSGVWALNTK